MGGGGKVYFVGAGPGDPELLTVKAHGLIRRGEVILHDDLVSAPILALASGDATVINVGKRCGVKSITQVEINRLMASFAQRGMDVVRLKGGDPGIFGRLGEEIAALAEAGINFEVVPGITTAMAVAARLGTPLTDRRSSSKVLFVSGHHARGVEPEGEMEWARLVAEDTTLAVYMPGSDLGGFARRLIEAGISWEIPSVVVSRVSTPEEQQFVTTLGGLLDAPAIAPPSILLIGWALERAQVQDFRVSIGGEDCSVAMC
jgi:uroporphyrin-III C-methyltransferase